MPKITPKYAHSYDGIKIFYEVCVNKHPACLVFLHGLGGSLTAWSPEIQHFHTKGISTIAIDLLGHGNSDRPNNPDRYHFINQARDVISVLKNERFENYMLVGHCYGAVIAMIAASHHHKTPKGLIIIASADYLPQYAKSILKRRVVVVLLAFLKKYFTNNHLSGRTSYEKYKGRGDRDIPRLFEDMVHSSLKSNLFSFQNIVDLDIKGVIENITVPTLVIASGKDSIFPPQLSKDLAARIKNSILTIMPNENHVVVINNPSRVNNAIDSFLKKIRFI